MALSNSAYDAITDEYLDTRMENERLYKERLSKTYETYPELKELDDKIMDLNLKASLSVLKDMDSSSAGAELESAKKKRSELIASKGIDPAYDRMIYTCKECRDTGSVETESGMIRKCRCFRQKESVILLKEFGSSELLVNNNFSKMRTDVMDDESRSRFLKAADHCRNYVENFDKEYKNILFFGSVGTGKSFLSCCIADELLKTYHSVIYMSAKRLFDELAKSEFSKDNNADIIKERIYDCDLLIIDDLGTEMTNSFVCSELFSIINERYNSRRSVIISTNLELAMLRDNYSDRIFSRITGSYDILKLSGVDLRTKFGQEN